MVAWKPVFFEHDNFAPFLGKDRCGGGPGRTGANNNDIKLIHVKISTSGREDFDDFGQGFAVVRREQGVAPAIQPLLGAQTEVPIYQFVGSYFKVGLGAAKIFNVVAI
jgi:hypothetical protein